MGSEMEVPPTTAERLEILLKNEKGLRHPDSPDWFNREYNEKLKQSLIWAAPYDARFPQVRKQRQCFAYYVDFHRCQELMGADYKPCKFFKNVYKDICPGFWVEKWDELVEEGRFPAKFDR
ncbi:Cytochrome c oxidase subunit 6B1 [Toxocara canis]|uniref:Cytochrome c oxidase subunit 6B1 n=1 Tax=Toxocara canis TaxID=6265 RepID=A0A0B2UW46_TOXCA|nr:Cytochrome c oxidase subunit 6B1 [Toxocara canis]